MPQRHYPAGNGQVTAPASRPSGPAEVLEAHQQAARRFRANGVGSSVREQGSGPTVLCLHGMIGTSFLYRKVLAELAARGLRGVAFDLPGFGLAERPPGYDYSWTSLGRFCVAAVDELGLDRFHLVARHELARPMPQITGSCIHVDVRRRQQSQNRAFCAAQRVRAGG
jgi:pimeloyl-ACP methyl ester carboxylesterase